MVTNKDIKSLIGLPKKLEKFGYAVFAALITLFVYLSFHNLYLSFHYAESYGLEFISIITLWNSEPVLSRVYSGYEQQSLHRLNMAILYLGATIFMTVQLTATIILRRRDKRILETLVEYGVVTSRKENA